MQRVGSTDETWKLLVGWVERAANAGLTFALSDLLIAALADEIGGLDWSLDRDFERMEQLGIVRLFAWPARPAPPQSCRRSKPQNPTRAVN